MRFAPELKSILLGGEEKTLWGKVRASISNQKLTHNVKNYLYKPLTLEERKQHKQRKLVNQYKEEDVLKYNKTYRSAILHNDYYWNNFYEKERMRNEIEYNHRAFRIYSIISTRKWCDADSIANHLKLNKREVIFIIRKWKECGIAEIIERTERYRSVFKFKIKNVKLYYLTYSNFKEKK
ncbi:hypothetical protein [Leptospira vanthielii]|uniref:hypothetical protein n=1 Tax=Leptospira vanthielii TaxID=293085 RepID=UPI000586B788|nr:hypothetical protein [Leptospira vanthielii]